MRRYNEEYDSYYDDEIDTWLEGRCGCQYCEYCVKRPKRPSHCKSIGE